MRSAAMCWFTRTTVVVACVGLSACAGSDDASGDDVSDGVAATTLYTGPAEDLAPSQRSQPTVPPPTVPDTCGLDVIAIESALGTPTSAPVIVVFRNEGSARCEVDLGTGWATRYRVEPSVWLDPSSEAELWGEGTPCADGEEAVWPLVVNGDDVALTLPAGAPCALVPTAFFPR